jgi:hypothetical protein
MKLNQKYRSFFNQLLHCFFIYLLTFYHLMTEVKAIRYGLVHLHIL